MPSKWAQHTGASDRILGIYALLLFSKKRYSLTQLSKLFDCSKQTMLRHLEQIDSRGEVDLVQEIEGNQKYVHVKTPNKPANVTIDSDALEYLSLCRDIVAHLLPGEVRDELEQTVSLASFVLTPKDVPAPGNTHVAGTFTKGAIDYSPQQKTIEALLQSIRNQQWVTCRYASATKKQTQSMRVRPIKLVAYREGLYLLHNSRNEPEPRMMPLQRIKGISVEKTTFSKKEIPRDDVPGTFGVIAGKPFTVVARVSSHAANYVGERTWSEDQQIKTYKDGSIKIIFTSTSKPEVISWVLGFSGEVELLEPIELREDLRKRLHKMMGSYQDS